MAAHLLDDALEGGFVGQEGRDVLEDDPRLRKVGNIANELPQLVFCEPHATTRRKYSRVRANPSSSPTSGCQPRSLRARVMSGRRCLGSSMGSGLNSIGLLEADKRTMIWASSSTVTSSGLPRLTGRSSPFSTAARTPRTRSDT